MAITALKAYLEALEHNREGDKEGAADYLAYAMGAEEPSTVIKHSVDKLLKPGLANDAILQILAVEVKRP